jgi:hypothetical protein
VPAIYHRIPEPMIGTVLYPLEEQKQRYPEIYQMHVKKYVGRMQLLDERVELLDRRWSEVLFFSPVHPKILRAARNSIQLPLRTPFRCYEFDTDTLDPRRMAVLSRMEMNEPLEYRPFVPEDLHRYRAVPGDTIAYWSQEKMRGNVHSLLWMHIPHILYQGALDTSIAKVIEG